MMSRTKLYRQRKYIFIATSLLLFYTVFLRLGQLVYSVIKLKANGFTVKSATFDSEINDSCQVSVASAVTCPINFELSDIRATMQFEFENYSVQIAEMGCTNIKISKFDSLAFDAAVTLKSLDLSELSNMFSARELTIKLQMTLQVRFLLLPLAFAVRSIVFRFDPNKRKDTEFQSAKSCSTRNISICGELHEDINRILGLEVLKELSVEKVMMGPEEFFMLRASFPPFITSKHAERYSINLKNHVVIFNKPVCCTVTIKSFVASNSTYGITLLIPAALGQSCLLNLLASFWTKGSCELEVSAIEAWKSGAYVTKYRAADNKGLLGIKLPFSRSSGEKPNPMHMQFKGFRVEENRLNFDFVCGNEAWLIALRRVMYSVFGDRKLCGSLQINGAELCRLSFMTNELPDALSLDTYENAMLRCIAEFNHKSRMTLRPGKIIEEASIRFESNPLFVDGVEIGFGPDHTAFLVVDGKRILRKRTDDLAAPSGRSILLEHKWMDPKDLMLCMKSELKNGASFRNDHSHLKVDIEDIDIRLLTRKLDIEIGIQKAIVGAQFQSNTEKEIIFSQGSFVTKLKERSGMPTEFSTDLMSYIIGSDVLVFIGESIQIPVQIAKGDFHAYRVYKDLSVKHIPTCNIASHVLEVSSISSSLHDMLAAHSLDLLAHESMTIENRFKCSEMLLQSLDTFKLSVAEMAFSVVWLDDAICLYFPRPALIVLEFLPQNNQVGSQYLSGLMKFAVDLIAVQNSFSQDGENVADNASYVVDKFINMDITLEDTSQILDFNFCVDFPTECTTLDKGLRLSLPSEFNLTILDEYTGKEVLKLSLGFIFTKEFLKLHLSLKGLVTSGLDRLVLIYDVGDGSICKVGTSIYSIREFLIAGSNDIAIMAGLLSHNTEANDSKRVESTAAQNILHIEPRGQNSSNGSLDLYFGICSETLNEFLSQRIAGIIGSLPLNARPRYLVLNVNASRLPSFHRMFASQYKSEPGIYTFVSGLSLRGQNLRFELEYRKKEHLPMTAEEVRAHNRPILERMYGPEGQKEIEYYEKYYGSEILKDDIFDKFLDCHVQLGIMNIWSKKDDTKQPHTAESMHSNILAIHNYLQGKEYSTPSRSRTHDVLSSSNECYLLSSPKIWSDGNRFGVFTAKCPNRINVMGLPFSAILAFEGIVGLHVRAFGLLSDPYLDDQSSNLVVPYSIHSKYTSPKLVGNFRQFKLYTLCGRYISCLCFSAGIKNWWYYNNVIVIICTFSAYMTPRIVMAFTLVMLKYITRWAGSNMAMIREVVTQITTKSDMGIFVKLDQEIMNEEYRLVALRQI